MRYADGKIKTTPLIRQRHQASPSQLSLQTDTNEPSAISKHFRKLDLFTKIESPIESSNRVRTKFGGIFSILGIVFICWLVLSNTYSFIFPARNEHLIVDKMFEEKLQITFDLEFHAIQCNALSIDVMDATGEQSVHVSQNIMKQKLDVNGARVGDAMHERDGQIIDASKNIFLANMFLINLNALSGMSNPMKLGDNLEHEGCRISGILSVQKVSGNFHLALGDAHEVMGKHIHQFVLSDIPKFNASHTIHYLSFGEAFPKMIAPLNSVKHVVNEEEKGSAVFTYNLKIIPTEYIASSGYSIFSNLYSYDYKYIHIKESNNPLERMRNARLPGVFFIYKMNPYMIQISDARPSFVDFLINLCAIAGGVFAMSGLLDSITFYFITLVSAKEMLLPSTKNDVKKHKTKHFFR